MDISLKRLNQVKTWKLESNTVQWAVSELVLMMVRLDDILLLLIVINVYVITHSHQCFEILS